MIPNINIIFKSPTVTCRLSSPPKPLLYCAIVNIRQGHISCPQKFLQGGRDLSRTAEDVDGHNEGRVAQAFQLGQFCKVLADYSSLPGRAGMSLGGYLNTMFY